MLNATVSGSFHRHMSRIYETVGSLTDAGVKVLSPADPRVVDHHGEFLFVASDLVRSIRLVQDRHIACISVSDFLWLVAPDGYVGTSAAVEIGAAIAAGVEVFCDSEVRDVTLQQYVRRVGNIAECIDVVRARPKLAGGQTNFLVDPVEKISEAQAVLEDLRLQFVRPERNNPISVER